MKVEILRVESNQLPASTEEETEARAWVLAEAKRLGSGCEMVLVPLRAVAELLRHRTRKH